MRGETREHTHTHTHTPHHTHTRSRARARRHILILFDWYMWTTQIGIGNTTAASAVLAALTGLPADQVCGAGTGMSLFNTTLTILHVCVQPRMRVCVAVRLSYFIRHITENSKGYAFQVLKSVGLAQASSLQSSISTLSSQSGTWACMCLDVCVGVCVCVSVPVLKVYLVDVLVYPAMLLERPRNAVVRGC
jgi:hypothetical protein